MTKTPAEQLLGTKIFFHLTVSEGLVGCLALCSLAEHRGDERVQTRLFLTSEAEKETGKGQEKLPEWPTPIKLFPLLSSPKVSRTSQNNDIHR